MTARNWSAVTGVGEVGGVEFVVVGVLDGGCSRVAVAAVLFDLKKIPEAMQGLAMFSKHFELLLLTVAIATYPTLVYAGNPGGRRASPC